MSELSAVASCHLFPSSLKQPLQTRCGFLHPSIRACNMSELSAVASCHFSAQLTEAAVADTLWFLTPVNQGLQH
jgi:hypothetical protein